VTARAESAGQRRPAIIAVDGRSGAGKTTLAVELATLLRAHHSVSLFHLEEIYPGWEGLVAGQQRYVETVLEPLREGRTAGWTAWDWIHRTDGGKRTTEPAEIVIVEGVGAACAAARGLLDVVVWVEAAEEQRRLRALERDGDTYLPYWELWAGQETAWLADDDVAAAADILVDGHQGPAAPAGVLHALTTLPVLDSLLAAERHRNRALVPVIERVDACPDPEVLFEALYADSPRAVWLDSSSAGAGAPDRNRFSIMADDGGRYSRLAVHRTGMTEVRSGSVTARIRAPFFRWLDSAWEDEAAPSPGPCEFIPGWIGYLGYELKRETGGSDVESAYPDAILLHPGRCVIVDHRQRCLYLVALARDTDGPAPGNTEADGGAAEWLGRTTRTVRELGSAAPQPPAAPAAGAGTGPGAGPGTAVPVFAGRDDEPAYKRKIRQAQEQIRDGNSYEICLTTTLEATVPAPLDPLGTYLALRRRNPAPFASYLRFDGLAVASTSPERLLRIDAAGAMRAEPIKGTRRRETDPRLDDALRQDLETSPKDRAENIMIVDLLRNDLSHAAVPGSVTVSRLCAIESYATVHQMVSTIDALLRPEASRAEAVAAAFPAGSMTGAPKISSMNILDRLEAGPRGVYSGAIGYFSRTGATDLSVAIRTLVLDSGSGPQCPGHPAGQNLALGIGGAITSDSVPDDEWDEIRTKAFGVLSALGAVFPEPAVLPSNRA
jgi:para-aminobenzoate synthetase